MRNMYNMCLQILKNPKENMDIIAITTAISLTSYIGFIDIQWAITYGWLIIVITSLFISYFISGNLNLLDDERTEHVKFKAGYITLQLDTMLLSVLCIIYLMFGIGNLKLTLIGILYFSSLVHSIWCAKLRRCY